MIFCGVTLLGCATTARVGNFASNISPGLNRGIVSDTIKQLETLYPPAQTQFSLGQAVPKSDVFGSLLVASLREKGYAVEEYNPKSVGRNGVKFQYLLDMPATNMSNIYRVKLVIGGVTLTRAYEGQNNTVTPAGALARLEEQL